MGELLATSNVITQQLLVLQTTVNQKCVSKYKVHEIHQRHILKYVCTKGCTSGGVYVPCIYSHARRELPQANRVFVVVFV